MDSQGGNGNPGQPPYGDPYAQPGSQPPPPYGQPGSPPPPYTQPGSVPDPYAQPAGTPPPYVPPGSDQGAGWSYQTPQGPGGPPGTGFGAPPYSPAPGGGVRLPNKKMLTILGGAIAVVVVIVVIVVAVGGGSGNSPTATVNGFIQAVLSNNGKAVCSYFLPADQAACDNEASAFKGASGNGQAVSQAIQGNEALVSITGQICAPYITGGSGSSGDCGSNSDASTGMPGNGVTFDQAYAAAVSSSNNGLSPVPLEEVNGKWYLNSGS